MDQDEFMTLLAELLDGADLGGAEVVSVGKVDGEDTLGVELDNGSEFFLAVARA